MAAGAPGGSHWEDSFCSRTGCCSETFAAQGWSSCAAEPAVSQRQPIFAARSWLLGMSAAIAGCSKLLDPHGFL